MNPEIRFNQPQIKENNTYQDKKPNKRFSFSPLGVSLFLLFILVLLFSAFYVKSFILEKKNNYIDTDSYNAVFLSNGQVYFGKITKYSKYEIVMKDVYYLQIGDNIGARASSSPEQTRFNLVKLGQEIHGPENELFINRDHIMFREILRDDSKVVESIKNFSKN